MKFKNIFACALRCVSVTSPSIKTGSTSAIDLLHYYDEYFGIRYALPKLDLIAVPGLINGAMENWGGITFFESLLLYDPGYSSERLKRDNYTILAHEMSHQWFGNLVTMAWWDDLWLNEGFATWMQAKATEELTNNTPRGPLH